jgi:RES domain-containing protein
MSSSSRVHDRAILDALDAMDPVPFDGTVWRITRSGREPTRGSTSNGRWNIGSTAEVLYSSLDRDGALGEIGFRLSLEPVWPSRISHEIHQITAQSERTLEFVDIASLSAFDVDISRYQSFDYDATQALAAAAHFLEFDGLLVPSARHSSTNLVLFMDRDVAGTLEVQSTEPVDWATWRRKNGI